MRETHSRPGRRWVLLFLLAGALPACHRAEQAAATTDQSNSSGTAADKPRSQNSPGPAAKKPPDPIDVDAERVLAAMPASWREMLAKAEEHDRRERVGWCITCHVNVRDELRGGAHDENDISCVDCHGASERHARDENNEIKPDQVFARKHVDKACGECHDCSREESATAKPSPRPVCTDCHTAHRFPLAAAPAPK
jgi:hypothetical protein